MRLKYGNRNSYSRSKIYTLKLIIKPFDESLTSEPASVLTFPWPMRCPGSRIPPQNLSICPSRRDHAVFTNSAKSFSDVTEIADASSANIVSQLKFSS